MTTAKDQDRTPGPRSRKLGICLRPIEPFDQAFLFDVYASTREDELAPLDWTDAQKVAFLRMQFDAQHRYYQEQYDAACFDVLLKGETAVGRLYVDRRADEHRIIDIALLTAHRNKGLGGAVMADLLDEAAKASKPVTIHVERFNPAMRLYQRLGFVPIEDQGVYELMEWRPPQEKTAS